MTSLGAAPTTLAMTLLNFSCIVASKFSLEYGKVTTIVTTNFEFAGAAGGEGAGVVGNGVEGVFKLPTEGLVSAEGGGVVVAVVVEGVVGAIGAEGVVAAAGVDGVVGAAGTVEGAGVVGNGVVGIFKLPTEGVVSVVAEAGAGGVVAGTGGCGIVIQSAKLTLRVGDHCPTIGHRVQAAAAPALALYVPEGHGEQGPLADPK